LAPVETYALYFKHKVEWEAHENYQKRSYRNRAYIKANTRPLNLTLPLCKGKNAQLAIKRVKLSYDDNWVHQVIETIRTNYGSAPYFEYYFPRICEVMQSEFEFLWNLNKALHIMILEFLQLESRVLETEKWEFTPVDKIDLRKDVKEIICNYEYFQIPDGTNTFIKGLSILDLLFCSGPEARLILHNIDIEFANLG